MNQLNLFIELTRIKKPIGFMLLFWPCIWGLTIAYDFNSNLLNYFFYSFLFLAGSILMRSAGCIVNDIADKNFDKKVERTKHRPIASGKVSVKLAFTYPLMKRITYWPQLFLGITFNYGLILAWISILNEISLIPIIFYLGAIFWTLGYDTIYGFQDIKDDEIIGVKSTSIKFKNDPKKFLFISYFLFALSLVAIGILMNFKATYFLFLIFPFYHLFIFQIKKLNTSLSENCFEKFKSNNFLGLLILLNLLIGKLI